MNRPWEYRTVTLEMPGSWKGPSPGPNELGRPWAGLGNEGGNSWALFPTRPSRGFRSCGYASVRNLERKKNEPGRPNGSFTRDLPKTGCREQNG